MSINISSDESNHSNHDEIDFMKKNVDNECVDLTQGDVDIQYEPEPYCPSYDDFDDILPEVQLSGSQVTSLGGSQGASTVSAASVGSGASSSGYGGSISSGSRCRSVDDKSNKKKTAAAAKLAKKQKLDQDKAARMAAAELNKVYKPGECMKYMYIEVHPALAAHYYLSDVMREARAAGARLEPDAALADPALLLWSRRVPRALPAHGQMVLTPSHQRCPRALYICPADEVAEHVRARSLAARVAQARALADCALTLVVHGVRDYFKSSNRRTANSNRGSITEIEFEMALTDLLVSADCDSAVVNTPNELALLIVQFTKAIAEEPHKKTKRNFDEQAEFYMRGDNKKCVSMDKDGNGASRLWQQMIAVLPGSSLEVSRSVCSQYKSPLALYQALQLPNGVNNLADIGISRTGVPGSKNRRLGPEFARKLNILFTAEDGDALID